MKVAQPQTPEEEFLDCSKKVNLWNLAAFNAKKSSLILFNFKNTQLHFTFEATFMSNDVMLHRQISISNTATHVWQ